MYKTYNRRKLKTRMRLRFMVFPTLNPLREAGSHFVHSDLFKGN